MVLKSYCFQSKFLEKRREKHMEIHIIIIRKMTKSVYNNLFCFTSSGNKQKKLLLVFKGALSDLFISYLSAIYWIF